jgi:hypothetical protein
MTLSAFIGWLNDQGCELVPMPDWNNANTIQIVNKRNGNIHYLNTRFSELFEGTIELCCRRLGVPLPPDYQE